MSFALLLAGFASAGNYLTRSIRMVYDCFMMSDELDLLEVRLHELDAVVDVFVAVESRVTAQGKPKPLHLADNISRFEPFRHKLRVLEAVDYPAGGDAWANEIHQRNWIKRGLDGLQDEDVVMISDIDEIPRAGAVKSYHPAMGPMSLEMDLYYYWLNCYVSKWGWAKILPGSVMKQVLPHQLRLTPSPAMPGGGWHFSYQGGVETILGKIQSYAHSEFNTPEICNRAHIEKCINEPRDVLGRKEMVMKFVPLDGTWPKYIVGHLGDKFRTWYKPLPPEPLPQYFSHARSEIAASVPPDALNILDVGCGAGMLGRALKAEHPGRRVVGIELNPDAARAADANLDEVYEADVENFAPPFVRGEFDCIIFADILEHLRDPWSLVRQFTAYLSPGGMFIASIPNVRFLGLIGDLAERGAWAYGEDGILDRTHLRFFTKKEFMSLMADADIRCDSVEYLEGGNLGEVRSVGADLFYGNLSLRNTTRDQLGELSAYQMVFAGRYIPGRAGRKGGSAAADPVLLGGDRAEGWITPEAIESELSTSPGNREIQTRLAASYVRTGRTPEAVKIYQDLLAADPDDCGVLLGLGDLCVTVNDRVTASKFFKRVLTLDPNNARASRALGDSPAGTTRPLPVLNSRKISGGADFERYALEMKPTYALRQDLEKGLIEPGERFTLNGYCHVCGTTVDFTVEYTACYGTNGSRIPNWREQIVCPSCGLNNRSRGALHLLENLAHPSAASALYIAEQTTPLYAALAKRFPRLIGSEYLGHGVPRGSVSPAGLRHEDLTALSFGDGTLDSVLTFDVFEHVPDYRKAFRECFRVLAPGGTLVFTVPFDCSSERNLVRAVQLPDGTIKHILPPEYHGDPVNAEAGCLCYQVFGWELLADLKQAGFQDAGAHLYWSRDFGYLGGDQIIFTATKAAKPASGKLIRPMPFWDRDEEFARIMQTVGATLVDRVRCYMLYQFALQASSLGGDVAEVGVYKGGTARLLAMAFAAGGKTVHLFDTFGGMPSTDPGRDMHRKGDFSDTSLEGVKRSLEGCRNVEFYPGVFPATAPPVAGRKFCLAHIDVDIYRSVLDCCEFFYPRMAAGGVMVFDDYGFEDCPGAKAAVDEFFREKRERPFYLPSGQCAVIKI